MAIFEVATGVFAMLGWNNSVVACMLISVFIYMATMGPYTYVYCAEIGNEQNQAIGLILGESLILSLTVNYMFDGIGVSGTFFVFAFLSGLVAAILYVYMRETKGLTQEQTKILYVPQHLLKEVQAEMPENEHLIDNKTVSGKTVKSIAATTTSASTFRKINTSSNDVSSSTDKAPFVRKIKHDE